MIMFRLVCKVTHNILFPKQTFDYHVINDSIGEINPLGGVTQMYNVRLWIRFKTPRMAWGVCSPRSMGLLGVD